MRPRLLRALFTHFPSGAGIALLLTLAGCSDSMNNRYTVSTQSGEGGRLSPNAREVPAEQTAEFRIEPEAGYRLRRINGCNGQALGNRYTTGPIESNCTVSAEFQLREYRISTAAGANGQISPSLQFATIEDQLEFTLTPDEGYRVAQASGCGGTLDGDIYTVSDVSANCTVRAQFEQNLYRVSGEISATALTTLDPTVNDPLAYDLLNNLGANDNFETAREVNNLATVIGYASALGTDVACDSGVPQRYGNEGDPIDFYRVSLQEGQLLRLQVVNHDGHSDHCEPGDTGQPRPAGDLNLTLLAREDHSLVSATIGGAEFQELVVPQDGDYLLKIKADAGISRYLVQLLPAGSTPMTRLQHSVSSEFIAGEMLVQYHPVQAQSQRRAASQHSQRPRIHLESVAPLSTQTQRSAQKCTNPERKPGLFYGASAPAQPQGPRPAGNSGGHSGTARRPASAIRRAQLSAQRPTRTQRSRL